MDPDPAALTMGGESARAEQAMSGRNDVIQVAALVATRDRPDDLRRLLESLARVQAPDALDYRIVIVDNSANGNAEAIVAAAPAPFPIAYLHEPRPGLSRARNAGLGAIPDGYVATLDDDIIVPEDYLVQLERAVRAHPGAGAIGGRVELFNREDYPISIRLGDAPETYQGGVNIFGFIPGCNQVIRRAALARVGAYDVRLGAGTPTSAAEDDDMIYRIWKQGYEAVYAPDLRIFHNHGRKADEAGALQRNYIKGNGAFLTKHMMRLDPHAAAMFVKLVPWCFKAILFRAENADYARKYLKYYAIGAARFLTSFFRR